MRVLVISNCEWDDNNSFGNTFSNFFTGIDDIVFFNIYCRNGIPNTKLCNTFLRVSDKQVLKYRLGRVKDPAEKVENQNQLSTKSDEKKKISEGLYSLVKRKRWSIVFLIRELLWGKCKFTNNKIFDFVDNFNPDIILLPTYPYNYINKIALQIHERFDIPIVSYMSDDEYSYRVCSFSPLFWLRRYIQRQWVIKSLKESELVYVISDLQKDDLKRDLNINSKILTKSYDFRLENCESNACEEDSVVKILYAGNLSKGRFNTIRYIADAVSNLNAEGFSVVFDIYTPTVLSEKMLYRLNNPCCFVHKAIPYSELLRVQECADIVVHVEGFDLKSRLEVRQSFSTKLVDYFFYRKCIFAVGPSGTASIDYLMKEDVAIVALSKEDVSNKLKKIVSDKNLRFLYEKKSYKCGMKNHSKTKMQTMLHDDLIRLIRKE